MKNKNMRTNTNQRQPRHRPLRTLDASELSDVTGGKPMGGSMPPPPPPSW
jgi:hypothetical protein